MKDPLNSCGQTFLLKVFWSDFLLPIHVWVFLLDVSDLLSFPYWLNRKARCVTPVTWIIFLVKVSFYLELFNLSFASSLCVSLSNIRNTKVLQMFLPQIIRAFKSVIHTGPWIKSFMINITIWQKLTLLLLTTIYQILMFFLLPFLPFLSFILNVLFSIASTSGFVLCFYTSSRCFSSFIFSLFHEWELTIATMIKL